MGEDPRWLTELERSAGVPIGVDPATQGLPAPPSADPLASLQGALLPLVSTGPCLVAFSGGRDSSAVLAAAVDTARAAGCHDPVPVSLRFDGVESTEESNWQELLVRHLHLDDWQRVSVGAELDFLGEVAQEGLRRHGLLWPANAHFVTPVLRLARGGVVLTGFDGDGLFGGWRWARPWAVLRGRERPSVRDAARAALMAAPQPARRAWLARRAVPWVTWLHPTADALFRDLLGREAASQPRVWSRWVRWYATQRYLKLAETALAAVAADHAARIHNPLLDRGFLTALARAGGRVGFGTRAGAMRALFADLLPEAVLTRRSKAEFGRAFWGPNVRAFAEQWDGTGVDLDLLDLDRFRAAVAVPNPPIAAATVLQAGWVAVQAAK